LIDGKIEHRTNGKARKSREEEGIAGRGRLKN
jgi:hypothetical protein